MNTFRVAVFLGILALTWRGSPLPAVAAQRAAQPTPVERPDLLTFAQGAVPVSIGGAGVALGASFETAIRASDGNPAGFVLTQKPGAAATDFEFVYELPAPTVFDRFAVPNVLETPSPTATFVRSVEVHGSPAGPSGTFTLLASATLTTHAKRGEVTELTIRERMPVRWVKLRLSGGIQVPTPQVYLEFSEIIGNGRQELPAMRSGFQGIWKGRGVLIELRQDGAVVSGCYDRGGQLSGTVTGNVLRATGFAQTNRVPSAFILGIAGDGSLRGVRSTNGGPFAVISGDAAAGASPTCPQPPPPLGCGSVIHGITFDFDAAVLRADSAPILASLYGGLSANKSATVVIEGHTSDEGTDDYNLRLSQRRAQTVVDDLTGRGIVKSRLQAVGVGEARPMLSNADESGRALNRRVEVHCK